MGENGGGRRVTLELSDFDAAGLETAVLALITAGPRDDVYRAPANGGPVGTLHAGSDLELRPGQDITRIRIRNNGAELRMWDTPSPETFSSFFGAGGAGADLTVHVQTAAGVETMSIGTAGSNYLNVEGEPAAFLDAIVEGTRFILALTRPAPVENRAPTADAGPDQDAAHGAPVALDGSGSSDPDAGDAITFLWTQESGPTVTLTGADTARPTFTAPDLETPSELVFTLVVSDAAGAAIRPTPRATPGRPGWVCAFARAGSSQGASSVCRRWSARRYRCGTAINGRRPRRARTPRGSSAGTARALWSAGGSRPARGSPMRASTRRGSRPGARGARAKGSPAIWCSSAP